MLRDVGVAEGVGVCVFVLGPGHSLSSPTWRNKLGKKGFF